MSNNPVDSVGDAFAGREPAKSANLVYILYLVGLLVPVVPIVGVVLAYMYRAQMTDWLASHNTFQIRTFWIGLLYGLVAIALSFIGIGVLLLIALTVWLIIRCVKGFKGLQEKRAPTNVDTWLI